MLNNSALKRKVFRAAGKNKIQIYFFFKNLVENWFHISAKMSIQYMSSFPFTEGGGQRYSKRTASGNCRYKIGERWFVLLCLLKLQNYLYLLFVLTEAHSADGHMNKQPLVWVNSPSLRMPAFPLNNKQRVFEYEGQSWNVSAFHVNQSLRFHESFIAKGVSIWPMKLKLEISLVCYVLPQILNSSK